MFNQTVRRNHFQYALRLLAQYEGLVLSEADQVLPSVVESLHDPFYMDVQLAIVKRFLPRIRFIYVDQLIEKIAKLVDEAHSENGIMICNINPFMVTAAILNFGVIVKATFPLTIHRIEKYEDDLRVAVGTLLEDCYEPYLIEKLMNQKDIDGVSPLYIFAQHKYYSIMKTDVADRIIMNKWNSKVDTSGSILENSTPYNMLTFYSTSYKDDFEEEFWGYFQESLETWMITRMRTWMRTWRET